MTEVDGARSAGKTWCVVLVLMALIAVGFAAALAVWPDLLPLGSGRIVGQVSIAPQEAAQAGGQWRVVSQWQAAGEMQHMRHCQDQNGIRLRRLAATQSGSKRVKPAADASGAFGDQNAKSKRSRMTEAADADSPVKLPERIQHLIT